MLVIARRQDESLIINGNIEVVVTGVRGGKVSLGIIAPTEISVFRKELCGESPKKRNIKSSESNSLHKQSSWNVLKKIQSFSSSIR